MTERDDLAVSSGPEFSELDRQFGWLMERLAGEGEHPELRLAAALVSQRRTEGNVCLELPAVVNQAFALTPGGVVRSPDLESWRATLRAASPVVGSPGEVKPLILDDRDRLYLRRYWWYEQEVAAALRQRIGPAPTPLEGVADRLSGLLHRLFPDDGSEINWQRVAAFCAWRGRLTVISGGPGTGKTTTVVRLLVLLAELASPKSLHFAIAAPTGKAAARLQESLRQQKADLAARFPAAASLPDDVRTLHRLLGPIAGSTRFRHGPDHPLPVEVVVVDEASMVDLALMAKLLRAIPAEARVILLGDQDQLASVEAGYVLGDISANPQPNCFPADWVQDFQRVGGGQLPQRTGPSAPLAATLVQLQTNHRFGPDSRIHRLSQAVNRGDADAVLAGLNEPPLGIPGDVLGCLLPDRVGLKEALRSRAVPGFRPVFHATDPAGALAALSRFRLLAAVREGPYGVGALNALTEELLRDEGCLGRGGDWYIGRPVLVTANDYEVGLFNGDLGVVGVDEQGHPAVWFFEPGGGIRHVAPGQLPPHETAYAMTVHKSQGSEFTEVLLILPDRPNRVLTRELVYTGLTRSRERTEIWYQEAVLREAIRHRTARISGLREQLWGRRG